MEKFIATMRELYGQAGQAWLDRMPSTIAFLASKWQLSELKPFSNLSYHYALGGECLNKPIVLKLGFDRAVLQREVAALRAFDGHGCVKLLAYDDGLSALLIERVVPGRALSTYFPAREQESVTITCDLIKKLHSVDSIDLTPFPTVNSWLLTLDKPWNIPVHMLKKARMLRDYLLATTTKPILLHGDLHHDNILLHTAATGDLWLAIDPKGVVGEPAYDVGSFLRNPDALLDQGASAENIIKTRIAQFAAQLDLDATRIRDCGFVQSVMAACWAVEDRGDPSEYLAIAEIFGKL